mmetsp:Transcript_22391/g.48926  ORF Transcript_22391/g.48926 Transcript_22391/m.48926 type:complete len:168 (+) Transcript_22391:51-554(+)|eukprot:CAMPEP_0202897966 /NCGR_PEP_ID=MMETSP1392-20130828/6582_1 /ASSEMBLY_ACC=CAM_ASM_000868 /TAXON_ID=225041 /ORGANISM="Chlamydomonas chlamydogama, Strain SAG 11-48b" /LENGTH=167 /DNA_ID=CAMNT_0049583745 /DNA_START=51 /DNA_END=554 /DNA_ORIENTATION=-
MADAHAEHEDETFEQANAGASLTYPMQASSIRKNAYMVMKDQFPCKVVDVSTSKTGKHGHAKCHFVAVDIFTGKKYEDIVPSTHNCSVPNVSRAEYSLIDINDEGFVTLLTEGGDTREDLTLPTGTDDADKLAAQLKVDFNEGKELIVTVTKAMGIEMISSVKTTKS